MFSFPWQNVRNAKGNGKDCFIGFNWCVHTYNCKEKKKEMIIIKSLGMDYYTKVSLDDHRKNSIGIIERHAYAAAAAVTILDF